MEKGYVYNIEEPKSGKAVKVAAVIFAAFICMAIGILVGCEIIMRPQVQALEEESRAAWDAYNYERSRTVRDDSAIGWMFGDMTEEEVAQLLEHYGQVLARATDDLNEAADYIIAMYRKSTGSRLKRCWSLPLTGASGMKTLQTGATPTLACRISVG